jgi:hypothetical protein
LEANMTDLRQAGVPIPKFKTPRPECRWEKASDGALVMVWSVPEPAPADLRVVGGNPNAGRLAPTDEPAGAAKAIARVRSAGERVAIALLLGASGYLTLISFMSDYANFP